MKHLLKCAYGLVVIGLVACPSTDPSPSAGLLDSDGRLNVRVTVPESVSPGLASAGADVSATLKAVLGTTESAPEPTLVIEATVEPSRTDLGPEDYALSTTNGSISVVASGPIGAMYGLSHVDGDLGARYLHPEQTEYIPYGASSLPDYGAEQIHRPTFQRRGFHHHTQHPIIASDVLLRPGNPGFRDYASRMIRYLARNRQNTLSWHMLKTMDLAKWAPYMADIAAEARGFGVSLGCVTSFADQQQNNFKLITDPTVPAEPQIRANLDAILDAGLSFIAFQTGTSEFTKPADAEVIGWMNTAVAHVRDAHPGVATYAWIHITCGLEDDNGGHFYHLPLQADPDLGAWVHTTMFYAMDRPAPVYGCQDFNHQNEFIEAATASGRELIWFPESAWWLGFDNNLPLVVPLTGLSRQEDIERFRATMTGHVTFTSGREWTYWQYDHFLTRATWDADVTWDAYLDWLAPVYGAEAEAAAQALKTWTALQQAHIYEDNPLIYFYLAGELPQDELGEAAGILARRPKLSFQKVLAFDDAELAAWNLSDLGLLRRMLTEYQAAFEALPARSTTETSPRGNAGLYAELHRSLWVYVKRIEHAIALYEGVVAARAQDRPAAQASLATARGITAEVVAVIAEGEASYRYPLPLMIVPKPESLTSYPFGYLWETSTGFFWARRDDQLALVIEQVFEGVVETWVKPPDNALYSTGDDVTVVEPASELAGTVLAGFVPQVLFGMSDWDAATGALAFTIAQDYNDNFLPDPGTELTLTANADASVWSQTATAYPIEVHQTSGEKLASLLVLNPEFRITPASMLPTGADTIELIGQVQSQALIDVVIAVAGIDPEGIGELIKGVWEIPAEDPLPALLNFHLSFAPKPVPSVDAR